MKRKQRPNVSLLLWLTKEFIILSILSNLVCTALYMAVSWLLTGTPPPRPPTPAAWGPCCSSSAPRSSWAAA